MFLLNTILSEHFQLALCSVMRESTLGRPVCFSALKINLTYSFKDAEHPSVLRSLQWEDEQPVMPPDLPAAAAKTYLYWSATGESCGSSLALFLMSFNNCRKTSASLRSLFSLYLKVVSGSSSISSSTSSRSATRQCQKVQHFS